MTREVDGVGVGVVVFCSYTVEIPHLDPFFFFLQLLKLLYSAPHLLYYVCTVWYKYESNLLLMKCVCAVTYADDILMFLDGSFFFLFFFPLVSAVVQVKLGCCFFLFFFFLF